MTCAPSSGHGGRRRAIAVRGTVALAAALGIAAMAGMVDTAPATGGGSAPTAGPVSIATVRDLRTIVSIGGTLERSDSTTVLHGGRPTNTEAGVGPSGATDSLTSSGDRSDSATLSAGASGVNLAAAGDSIASSTVDPCTVPGPPPATSTTIASTSTSAGVGTTSTAPATTVPPTTTTTGEAPCPPTTTTTPTAPTTTPAPPAGGATGATAPGAATPSGSTSTEASASETLTSLLAVGARADRGTVLYTADAQPVVVVIAAEPLVRTLERSVVDGSDVAALEANLVALGFGTGLTVDEHFDADTANAVEAWETALDRAEPDGVVAVGEVVVVDAPTTVLRHESHVGDPLDAGTPVVTIGSESQVVSATVEADELDGWTSDADLAVVFGDDTRVDATLLTVGRDETSGGVAIVVALAAAADRPIGSAVEVARVLVDRAGVVAVPVVAVVAGPNGPAVRAVTAAGDRVVSVELGIVDGGWVEVVRGLEPGTEIRRPA